LLKGFLSILIKELKELIRDPKILLGMIIVPLIMFPILGSIMNFSIQSAQEKAEKATLLVLNNDGGKWSEKFINTLNHSVKVFVVNNTTPEDAAALGLLSKYNTTQFIEIPSDFNTSMTEHLQGNATKATVNFYGVFSGTGMFESIGSSMIDNLVYGFNRVVAPDAVGTYKSAIIKGKIQKGVDPAMLSNLMISQAIAMPITIMILVSSSMQIAATSVAMEKEEKTLETLLSLPVDRFAILMGKLSGSILVAAVGALAYMVGFNYYMGSFTAAIPADTSLDLVSLGLAPSLFGYLLLGISLFVTLLSALALAVIISAFAEDVRGAQSLVGFIYPLIFIPSILLMYLDVNSLPLALRIFIYAIPFSHPTIAAKAVTMGDYWIAVWGIVYVTAFTFVIMYVASRLFATEKILTAKLKFKWFRRYKRKPAE
jgi:ABC-2 type transport system permease protein